MADTLQFIAERDLLRKRVADHEAALREIVNAEVFLGVRQLDEGDMTPAERQMKTIARRALAPAKETPA